MSPENKIKCKNRIVTFLTNKMPAYPNVEVSWVFKYADELYHTLISEGLISNISYDDFYNTMASSYQFAHMKSEFGV
jgi:hypothetical protein